MFLQSGLAYIHYLSFLILVSSVVFEYFTIRRKMNTDRTKIMGKADMWYGISAVLVLATGFIRVFYGGKGSDYYFSNSYFLLKLGLFTVAGIISIFVTIAILNWQKAIKTSTSITLNQHNYRRLKTMILVELILIGFIPLFAALMARGLG